MEFFEEAFHWLAGVSEKLPVVDIKMFFIVVLSVISGIGVITAFTLRFKQKNQKIPCQRRCR